MIMAYQWKIGYMWSFNSSLCENGFNDWIINTEISFYHTNHVREWWGKRRETAKASAVEGSSSHGGRDGAPSPTPHSLTPHHPASFRSTSSASSSSTPYVGIPRFVKIQKMKSSQKVQRASCHGDVNDSLGSNLSRLAIVQWKLVMRRWEYCHIAGR